MGSLQRIKEYLTYKGINNKRFEESVGLSNGSFASQLKRNGTIGVNRLEDILTIYYDLNPTWVLLGTGNMLLTESISSLNEGKSAYKTKSIPGIDNFMQELIDRIYQLECDMEAIKMIHKIDVELEKSQASVVSSVHTKE